MIRSEPNTQPREYDSICRDHHTYMTHTHPTEYDRMCRDHHSDAYIHIQQSTIGSVETTTLSHTHPIEYDRIWRDQNTDANTSKYMELMCFHTYTSRGVITACCRVTADVITLLIIWRPKCIIP